MQQNNLLHSSSGAFGIIDLTIFVTGKWLSQGLFFAEARGIIRQTT